MLSANQIREIKEKAYCGLPAQFYNICQIYPYTIREIVEMGTSLYNSRLGFLLLTETDIVNIIKEKTGEEVPIETIHPLEYLLQGAAQNDKFFLELKNTFSTFTKEEITLLPKINSVLVGSYAGRRLITEENFRDFQDILRLQNRKEVVEPPPKDESPGQRKMRLLREKVAAVKKKQAQKKGEGLTLLELMEIADTFGIDKDNSLYAFYCLLHRYQMREKWNQDLQMICAGADSKKMKTKYWGESLDE